MTPTPKSDKPREELRDEAALEYAPYPIKNEFDHIQKGMRIDFCRGADWQYLQDKARIETLKVRVEGMVLSLEKHGQNIDVQFHIDWLNRALKEVGHE